MTSDPTKQGTRWAQTVIVMLIAGTAIFLFAGLSFAQVTSSSSPEAMLAAQNDNNLYVSAARIREFGQLLDVLERHCRQNRSYLADMTHAARNSLRDRYGIVLSLYNMLRAESDHVQGMGLTGLDCASVFTTTVMRLGRN